MSIEQDLLSLKAKGEKLNIMKIENATKLQGLEAEKEKLVAEAQALGIAPDKIEEVLKAEEATVLAEVAALDVDLSRILGQVNGI
jgi:hypothetical protein